MKFLTLFLSALLLILLNFDAAEGNEIKIKTKGTNKLTGFFDVGNTTYFAGPLSSSHVRNEVIELCRGIREGMTMVSFETEEKWTALQNFINENDYEHIDFMTSGRQTPETNVWVWETVGKEFTYTYWRDSEPSEEWPENCCFANTEEEWNDFDCQVDTTLVCETPLKK